MIKSYIEAIREALTEEMEKDNSIFLIGEDIGVYGGAFGVTKGLYEKFGAERVIDTPMSESAIIGLCNGAALNGMRPIAEIMFMDFIGLCYDQLLNHAGIFSYISDGHFKVPLVIRTPAGGGRGYGATHSKTLASALMVIPGIKIIFPSSPTDAKGLVKAAIRDNNPVVFIEHKLLYHIKADVPDNDYVIEIGKANIIKKGDEITVVSYGKMLTDCLKVIGEFKDKVGTEIIDLRTLKPLDYETIKNSVKKTGRLLVVEEDYLTCGIGAEICAMISEKCFPNLKTAPRRLATKDLPFPCCPTLEQQMSPSREDIKKTILEMIKTKDG